MKKILKPSAILFAIMLLIIADSQAQRGHHYGGGRFYGRSYNGGYYGRSYGSVYHRPSVSIGIGGIFGSRYPSRIYGYGRPRVGVSVGIGFPGVGVYINTLPFGYRRFYYGGYPYYYYNDTYYRQLDRGGYESVAPPLGSYMSKLPTGARRVTVDGETLYELQGTYYMPEVDDNDNTIYIVVGAEGDLDVDGAMKIYDENDRTNSQNVEEPNRSYNNNTNNDNQVIVRNGNDQSGTIYGARPEVGDRFEQLPKDSKSIYVNGEKQFVSPGGVYYKEVVEEGSPVYEVVRVK